MTSTDFAAAALPTPPRMDRGAAIAAFLAIVIAFAEIALDVGTPLELDLASMYTVPLLLAAYTRRRSLLWALSVLLGVSAVLVYMLHSATVLPALRAGVLVNRLLDVVALLITTGVLHVWMNSLDVRASQSGLLSEQNRRLETANRMLVEHEAQILRQNQELDLRHKEVVASSERTNRLLVAVSHDIRTPIQTIGLVAELMRRTGDDPALASRVAPMARQLQANAATLVSMVSDLLDLARLDSGRTDLNEGTFALDELVTAKCRELAALAEAKSLSLVAVTPPGPLWVRTDRSKVVRVLANLIGNAIKFTANGEVTVSLEVTASGSPMLRVTDTGCGIEAASLERIFDEYTQAGRTEPTTERGWGLGLAISGRLAKALGATIDVSSELGRGSTFTLTLPADCVVDIAPLELPASA